MEIAPNVDIINNIPMISIVSKNKLHLEDGAYRATCQTLY